MRRYNYERCSAPLFPAELQIQRADALAWAPAALQISVWRLVSAA